MLKLLPQQVYANLSPSLAYKARNPDGIYFITTTTIEWVDVFTRPIYKDILVNSLRHCQQHKGLELHAWVIMTNHIHLIASSAQGKLMGNIIRDF